MEENNSLFGKVNWEDVPSYYRFAALLINDGITLEDLVDIKTVDVINGKYEFPDKFPKEFFDYMRENKTRVTEYVFGGYKT